MIAIAESVVVINLDADGNPPQVPPVYALDGAMYTGHNGTSKANGDVSFALPQGDYRFRADRDGTQFWSASTDDCAIPGCEADSVTVTKPVIVTVASELGDRYPDLPVYVFDGDNYTGFNGTSDENGQVAFTLPQGDYRFRADFDGVQFWNGNVDHCAIPGCEAATVTIPGGLGSTTTTIDYTYEPLKGSNPGAKRRGNRLTAADYSSGEFFHYTYGAVGNLLTEETHEETNTYSYNIANRLTSVNGVSCTWEDKGNLLDDGREHPQLRSRQPPGGRDAGIRQLLVRLQRDE